MATTDEVEETLTRLITRFERLDSSYRSMLPSRRTVEAVFTDLDTSYHVRWRSGELSELHHGSPERADIRIHLSSDDLLEMAAGDLGFRKAYATDRVRLEASMTDILRLRSVLG